MQRERSVSAWDARPLHANNTRECQHKTERKKNGEKRHTMHMWWLRVEEWRHEDENPRVSDDDDDDSGSSASSASEVNELSCYLSPLPRHGKLLFSFPSPLSYRRSAANFIPTDRTERRERPANEIKPDRLSKYLLTSDEDLIDVLAPHSANQKLWVWLAGIGCSCGLFCFG